MQVLRFDQLASSILSAPPTLGITRLICVDGPAGSGKSTFAGRLASALNAPLVRMDDLYEGWDGAFTADLPGRIDAWLLTPLRHGLGPRHLRFDWLRNCFGEWVELPAADAIVLEGVRSADTAIRAHASLVVWVESAEELRFERVVQRDGEAIRPAMEKFQSCERVHFVEQGTREAADLIVRGDPVDPHDENAFVGEAGTAGARLTL